MSAKTTLAATTNKRCGAKTVAGKSCRLPGTRHDGHCHIHSAKEQPTLTKAKRAAKPKAVAKVEPKPECPVCYGTDDLRPLSVCRHSVCGTCLPQLVSRTCPLCRTRLPDWKLYEKKRLRERREQQERSDAEFARRLEAAGGGGGGGDETPEEALARRTRRFYAVATAAQLQVMRFLLAQNDPVMLTTYMRAVIHVHQDAERRSAEARVVV
jgi:hypothetical protein